MNGFDWNNNGQNDLFDSFMDYHICNESSNSNNQSLGQPTKNGGMSKGAIVLIVLAIIGWCCQIGSCVMG